MTFVQAVFDRISSFDDDRLADVLQYVNFLDYREQIEDSDDLMCANERESEPSVPAEEVRRILGL